MSIGISTDQLAEVRAQMKELIEESPVSVSVTRYRMNTDTTPPSWDEDYGEVADYSEIAYTQLILTGQMFDEISEHDLYGVLGGDTEVSCYLHFVYNADLQAGDYLELSTGRKLMVFKLVNQQSYLQVFCKDWTRPQ